MTRARASGLMPALRGWGVGGTSREEMEAPSPPLHLSPHVHLYLAIPELHPL